MKPHLLILLGIVLIISIVFLTPNLSNCVKNNFRGLHDSQRVSWASPCGHSDKKKNYENHPQNHYIKRMINDGAIFLLGAVVTALIGMLFGVLTANRNRRNDSIKGFNFAIAIQKSELDIIDLGTEWESFYNKSKSELRVEIFKLSPHLDEFQRKALADIWSDYKSGETYQKINQAQTGGTGVFSLEFETIERGANSGKKEEILHDYLNKMDKIANSGPKFWISGMTRKAIKWFKKMDARFCQQI